MKLSVSRYSTILMVQIVLLLADISINSFFVIAKKHNIIMLILFILQDVLLIIALAVLLLTFFTTFVFQAGLVELLYDRFRLTIIICMVYFILTTILHIWTLSVRWKDPLQHIWTTPLLSFFILQRILAPFYYYFYKRAALRISDPRLYEDMEWIPECPPTK